MAELDELDELGVADWMSKGRVSTQRRLSADRDGLLAKCRLYFPFPAPKSSAPCCQAQARTSELLQMRGSMEGRTLKRGKKPWCQAQLCRSISCVHAALVTARGSILGGVRQGCCVPPLSSCLAVYSD